MVRFGSPRASDLGQPSEEVTMYKRQQTHDIMVMDRNASDLRFQMTGKTKQDGNPLPTQAVTTAFHFRLKPSFNLV